MKRADVLAEAAENQIRSILCPFRPRWTFSKWILVERVNARIGIWAVELRFIGLGLLPWIAEDEFARVQQILSRLPLSGKNLALCVFLIPLIRVLPQREHVTFVVG